LPLALGLSFFVSRRLVASVDRIQQGTAQFAAGQFQRRLSPEGIPELDQLVLSFNVLADSLQEVERRRQDLVADLTHELRTPLTVIGGYLEGLADGSVPADPQIYGRLNRETKRLKKLISALQELSRAEAGYLPLELHAVSLKPLCSEVLEKLRHQVPDDGPDLQLAVGELPSVWADPERVEQILINLLSNALRHTPKGRVRVDGQPLGDYVELTVSDTGSGIAPENLAHIFERFWRADRARGQETGAGSGIGLTIVKKLVEIQGGTVKVKSSLGQGSSFSFTLPVAFR